MAWKTAIWRINWLTLSFHRSRTARAAGLSVERCMRTPARFSGVILVGFITTEPGRWASTLDSDSLDQ